MRAFPRRVRQVASFALPENDGSRRLAAALIPFLNA